MLTGSAAAPEMVVAPIGFAGSFSGLEILPLLAPGAYCTAPASMALRASCKACSAVDVSTEVMKRSHTHVADSDL